MGGCVVRKVLFSSLFGRRVLLGQFSALVALWQIDI